MKRMRLYRFFGLETGRIYVEGEEAECFRYLQERFSSFDRRRRKESALTIYPEPIRKSRITIE